MFIIPILEVMVWHKETVDIDLKMLLGWKCQFVLNTAIEMELLLMVWIM